MSEITFGRHLWFSVGIFLVLAVATSTNFGRAEEEVPTALGDYVSRPENVFAWEKRGKQSLPEGNIYEVELTSQQWQGMVWKHTLQIFEPKVVRQPRHVLLFVTGGSTGRRPGSDDMQRGMNLALLTGARVATLHQVPNQPLFDGRVEDDLITETWLRYLKTGDERWPLLFPMVKSAVKAMDALEEVAKKEWNTTLDGFVITGASKRGWTSWLTPVVDKRVLATAPIVIDVLNFQPQMKHQLDTWGVYSEQIHDYTSKGLVKPDDETPREAHLRRMVDPYTYREQLSLPKLLINGTNDRYWVVDAMNLYWNDLVGPKYVLQVPNAGHGLDGGRELALGTLAAFFAHIASDTPLPVLDWSHADAESEVILRITSSAEPVASRLWVARSRTKDFREAKWEPQKLEKSGGRFVAHVALPDKGHVAHYAELQFEFNGQPFSLCTLVRRD